ncbi:MAG: hypothetical protein K6E86_02205 [Bacteroidales bacterium]|nr:hypothetical protein [Bacteroidales bacterium]
MRARQQIEVTRQIREELITAFGTSRMSVWRALSFADDMPICRRIRKLALEKGGILMTLQPSMETVHDADGYMRQYWPNDVLLEVSKATGDADLMKCGEVKSHWSNIRVSDLSEIQREAARMAGLLQ